MLHLSLLLLLDLETYLSLKKKWNYKDLSKKDNAKLNYLIKLLNAKLFAFCGRDKSRHDPFSEEIDAPTSIRSEIMIMDDESPGA